MTIKNSWLPLVLIGFASLLPSQVRKSEFKRTTVNRPDLIASASLFDPATRKVKVTIKNSEYASAKIETTFVLVFWDTKNTSHRIEKRVLPASLDGPDGYITLFTVPQDWSQLGIKADATHLIDEKNEDNNITFVDFGRPDLVITATLYDNELRAFRFNAKNTKFPAVAIATPFKIVFWDPTNTSQRSEIELSPAMINHVDGHTDYFRSPSNWSFQTGVKVDSANNIEEINEDNNIAFAELVRADLTIVAELVDHAQRKIKYTFRNTEYPSATVTKPVRVYIWDTQSTTNSEYMVFPAAKANLPAGHSDFFTIPASWSSHIGLKIDQENAIEENDETNNSAFVHF